MPTTEQSTSNYKTPKERRRKALFVGLSTAAVALLVLAGAVTALKPSADVTVIDAGSGDPIPGATVTLDDESYTTNSDGLARIRTFTTGTADVSVSRDAYVSTQASLDLRFGRKVTNEVRLELAKTAQTKSFTVRDGISERPVANALVRLGDGTDVKADGEGKVDLVFTDHGSITVRADDYRDFGASTETLGDSVSLVPSGDVIVVSNRDRGLRGLYRASLDGSEVTPLVAREGQGEDYAPLRSPDGSLVAFISTRAGLKDSYGNIQGQAYLVRADGTGLKKLSDSVNPEGMKWSPTGRYLYWVDVPQGEHDILKRYTVSSGQVATLFTHPAIYGDFTLSDDGTRIAFMAATDPNRSATLWVANVDGSNAKSTTYAASPYHFNRDGNVEFTSYVDNGRKAFVLFADSGVVQESQRELDDTERYVASPDGGTRAFVSTRDGKSNLYLLSRDDTEAQLTTLGAVSASPAPYWIQNGRYVVFAVQSPAETALYLVSPAGGTAKKITDVTLTEYGYY